jgi:hypothetical protein
MCNGYPGCPSPIKEKGHCCPVCPEEPEEELVSPENEGTAKEMDKKDYFLFSLGFCFHPFFIEG